MRLITFSLGDEMYGVDIRNVREVIELTPITRVPMAPPSIVGVTNLRGEILAVLDLGKMLGLGDLGISEESRIIVSEWEGDLVGVLVDGMGGTIDTDDSMVQPPLPTWKGKGADYILGEIEINGRIFILVDFERVLGTQETKVLTS